MSRTLPKFDADPLQFELSRACGGKTTLEISVMHQNVNRWFLAGVACLALAASASSAAERKGSTVPKSSEAVSHQESLPEPTLPDPGGAMKVGSNPAGQNSDHSENRNDPGDIAVRPSAAATPNASGINESGGKAAGRGANFVEAPHGIDLVRPDDGYGNPGLRRRATRSSLIALSPNKKARILPPVVLPPRLPSFSAAPVERPRNSAGVALPVATGIAKPDSLHTVAGLPASTGLTGSNSLGISTNETHRAGIHVTTSSTMPPVTGINGTNLGHVGASGIGGPAKDRTGINGSALRPRF
jgi:hypothetical protein